MEQGELKVDQITEETLAQHLSCPDVPEPDLFICLVVRREGSLYHTASDRIYLFLGRWGVSLTRPVLESIWSYVGWGGLSFKPYTGIYLIGGWVNSLC